MPITCPVPLRPKVQYRAFPLMLVWITQSVSSFNGWTGTTGSMNSTAGRAAREGTRPAGTRARTHWKSPLPNAPSRAGPVRPRVSAGIPACPSHASIIEGLSPGRTTTRTSTTPLDGVPGRIFHTGSYGPTQPTYGTADAPSRSESRPRTTNPACGAGRRHLDEEDEGEREGHENTHDEKGRVAVPPVGSAGSYLCLGFARCDGAHIRLLAQIRNRVEIRSLVTRR